jgi:uncharacterized circularly permuted ATP-grasp superfamily protein
MYNEMFSDDRSVRGPYEKVAEWISAAGVDLLKLRQSEAEAIFRKIGITFAVYGEGGDPERLIPVRSDPARVRRQRMAEAVAGDQAALAAR